jgi:hypothetical protein
VGTSPWTWPVILTLCFSAVALVLSVVSFGWQVISWRRSGAQMRVVTKWGIAGTPSDGVWFLAVDATNTGRLATEINQIGFQLSRRDKRHTIVLFQDALGRPITLPIPLAPGASTSVMYRPGDLLEVLRREGLTGKRARPFAATGHGRTTGPRKDLRAMAEELNRPV